MNVSNCTVVIAAASIWFHATLLVAHPGGHSHDESNDPKATRTWTLTTEGSHLHGSFVAANEGQVQIRRDDGVLITLAIDRLSGPDQEWIATRKAEIQRLNTQPGVQFVAQKLSTSAAAGEASSETPPPAILEHFKPFEKTLKLRWDEQYFYVGSNGIPDHPIMVGIRAWQQQVPIPQKYFGDNAWRIPLHPTPAKEPMTAKNNFLRGAIALAVNGVPIFNPLNNRGDDAFLFGELDEYGGHCGRADDYHYHIAPVHLEKTVGKGKPIGYALDGYPIYGYEESDGAKVVGLDWLNGHSDKAGNYHYHATKTYPYLNGGFYGEVAEREGQVDPQPRAEPLRPALPPLRDARITDFTETKPGSYRLTYDVRGKTGSVSYTLAADGSAKFVFVEPNGNSSTESYAPQRRGPGRNDRPRPPRPDDNPPRGDDQRRPPRDQPRPRREDATVPHSNLPQLAVTSSSVNDKSFISVDCTCDGAGQAPAVEWKGAPKRTKCFALSLWHTAPDQEKSYWVLFNIPADVTKLPKNSANVGTWGLNDKRHTEYDPMCSKGPGVKTYHLTVFALSEEVKLAPRAANRASLLAAIKDTTLAEGTLDFNYERKH